MSTQPPAIPPDDSAGPGQGPGYPPGYGQPQVPQSNYGPTPTYPAHGGSGTPYAPYGQGPAVPPDFSPPQQYDPEPTSSLRERALFVVVAALAGVALGVLGGWLWSVIADPPVGVLTDRGVFLTDELAYDQQVAMTLLFLVLGAGLGLLCGVVAGLWGRRHGVVVVVAVLVMTAIACAVSAWLGIEVFGPDPQAQVDAASVGDPITAALDISSKVAYLGWPIGGLVGLLIGVSTWTQAKAPNPVWASSNVSPH